MAVGTFNIDRLEQLEAAQRAAQDFTSEEAPWPEREELPESTVSAPTLPEDMIPAPLRPWLVDIAERSCVPLEFVAAPAMVALGAAIGRSVGIRPGRFDDYTVVPNLWGGIVGRPGTMKSNQISEATRPLRNIQAQEWETFDAFEAEAQAQVSRIEAEIEAIKGEMRKAARSSGSGSKQQPSLDRLQEQLAEKIEELEAARPVPKRYITQDATTEKLGELLKENPRGILLLRDELAGWLRQLDRYGREGDREFYLEAWNGTGGYTFDRIGRGTVRIKALTMSILGGIQPGKLRSYIDGALREGAGDDGLLQRFQVLVWPDNLGTWKPVDRWPDTEARQQAYEVFHKLVHLKPVEIGAEQDGQDDIPYLRFADDAQELYAEWRDALENRLRSNALADTPAFESHIAKYRSLIPSLALIFHLVDWADGAPAGPVSLDAVRLAAEWGDYLEAHARKVYAEELMADVLAAERLAKKIEAGEVKDGQTIRDIYRNGWQGLNTVERVQFAIDELAKLNWVRIETKETGGRSSEVLRLHPDLRGGSFGD